MYLKRIRNLFIDKRGIIVFLFLTFICIFRYISILDNPIVVDDMESYPYKTRTELYLAILVLIDIAYILQNQCYKIVMGIISFGERMIANLSSRTLKLKKIVMQSCFKGGIATLLFLIVSIILYRNVVIEYNYANYREKLIPYISICALTGEITDGMVIEQTFATELDEIQGVYLRTATYKRENNSNLNIAILSMDDVLLGQQSFSVLNAKDNDFTYFAFDTPISVGETKNVKCRITSDGNPGGGNGITLYRSTIDSYKHGKLFINGIADVGDCFLELSGRQMDSMLICWLYIGVSGCVFIFIGIAGYSILKKNRISLEYLFLLAAGTIGVLFILIVPPYAEHDGEAHFNTIYNYSNKLLGYEVSSEPRLIEKDEKDIIGNKFGYRARRGEYYSIYQMIKEDNIYTDKSYQVHELGLDISSLPIEYIFPIFGLTIGRILGIKIIYLFYLTRIFNFASYIILTFWAIKLIPVYKQTLFVIAILPMSLMQAASVSYDAMVMGTSFLFVSLCLYLIRNNIRKVYLLVLALLSVCLIYNKSAAYFPLIGLILLIPLKKQYGVKQRTLFWIVEIGCILFAIVNSFVGDGVNKGIVVEGTYSLFYSIEHPLWFIKILCNTIYNNFELYFKGLFGVSIFGISTIETPLILCIQVIAVLLLVYKYENNEMTIYVDDKRRLFILLCAVGSALMICLGTVSWTKIGNNSLWGIQGRYFIPILLPLMFLKSKFKLTEKKQKNSPLFYMCMIDGYYVLYVLISLLNEGI